ncbi:hypothetical protein PI125_g18871 [Phytophthora idaei]|nr:hypothetical protein PI125_g18871 [Phytophthora idaei]KAG3137501.1 hypothetical protein PI126_g17377 [Phytophthora idaei]
MRLLCLLVLIMAILAGYCYGHAKADTTDQVMSAETASKPLIFNGDKANRYLKGDKEQVRNL